jgi:hypothetical protein
MQHSNYGKAEGNTSDGQHETQTNRQQHLSPLLPDIAWSDPGIGMMLGGGGPFAEVR